MTNARTRGLVLAAAVAGGVMAGCTPTNENPPDQLLRDSLGLEESDRVFRVELAAEENRETPRPAELRVPPGAFVEFVTGDRRFHSVEFAVDSLSAAAADFLRSSGQDVGPPLLELGSRFVVSFADAPPGRYPYVVEGNGEAATGVIVVEAAGAES